MRAKRTIDTEKENRVLVKNIAHVYRIPTGDFITGNNSNLHILWSLGVRDCMNNCIILGRTYALSWSVNNYAITRDSRRMAAS